MLDLRTQIFESAHTLGLCASGVEVTEALKIATIATEHGYSEEIAVSFARDSLVRASADPSAA